MSDTPKDRTTGKLLVFGGTASSELTDRICRYIGTECGKAVVSRFADGEILVRIEENVRGRDCFLVQATCPPVNENLMELLIFLDCLRRASARRITTVIPYFGYSRQDRKSEGRTPITAKLVANMLTIAGADRVLTMHLHADQIQGFFDIPVDHLTAAQILAKHFMDRELKHMVTVSPDVGNVKLGKEFALRLATDLAVIQKSRISSDSTIAEKLIGSVQGRNVLLFDDIIATADTAAAASRLVRQEGVKAVYVAATHAVFAGSALERLVAAELDEIVVTDTIPVQPQVRYGLNNLTVLSVGELFGEAILCIHENRSVSALFDQGPPLD